MKFEDIENSRLDWVVFDGDGVRDGWDWMVAEIRRLRKIVEENQNNTQHAQPAIFRLAKIYCDNFNMATLGREQVFHFARWVEKQQAGAQ